MRTIAILSVLIFGATVLPVQAQHRKQQTINFGSLPNVTFGVNPITLTATASSGLPVSYAATGPASLRGSKLTVTGAGPITVTASQSGNNQYDPATPVSQSFASAPALLTVTANNAIWPTGAAEPPLTYTITGFVDGNTAAVVSGAAAESTTANSTSAPGAYPITFSTEALKAANYTFTYASGTLTVTPSFAEIVAEMTPIASYTFGTAGNVPDIPTLSEYFNPYGIAGTTTVNHEWEIYQPFNTANFVFTPEALNITATIPAGGGLFPGGINSGQLTTQATYTPGRTGYNSYATQVVMWIPDAVGAWPAQWFTPSAASGPVVFRKATTAVRSTSNFWKPHPSPAISGPVSCTARALGRSLIRLCR
jgi:hypothetical protein